MMPSPPLPLSPSPHFPPSPLAIGTYSHEYF